LTEPEEDDDNEFGIFIPIFSFIRIGDGSKPDVIFRDSRGGS